MKVNFSYLPEESELAAAIISKLTRLCLGLKLSKTTQKDGYFHAYLTTKKPAQIATHKEK